MKIRILSIAVILAMTVAVAGDLSIAQSTPEMQSYKVKSISGGNFDRDSRKNLQRLLRIAHANGTVLLWIATTAPYDPNVQEGSAGYENQQQNINSYHQEILADLGIDNSNAEFTANGPYVAIDATGRQMVKLIYMDGVKGFWGIIGAGSVAGE